MSRATHRRGWIKRALVASVVGTATVATPIAASAEVGGFAEPDTATTTEDAPLPVVIDVLTNDTPGAVITGFGPAGFGTVGQVITDDVVTALTYQPDPDANGIDSFTYEIETGDTTETETVTVTVTETPDAPEANDDDVPGPAVTLTEGDAALDLTDLILANDFDVDGDETSIVSVDTTGTAGTVVFAAGSVTYEPTSDSATTDSFTYTIADDSEDALEATATVSVTIIGVDDAPVAVDDTATAFEDGSISVDVTENDTDVDEGPKAVESIDGPTPAIGSADIDADSGEIVYTAPTDLAADIDVAIDYTLNGGSSATLTITVSPFDDAPVAVDDVAEVAEAGSVTIDVLENDTDVDAGPLEVLTTTDPTVGSVVIEDDDRITYTHVGDSLDDVAFTYTVNGGDEATVTVSVTNSDEDIPVFEDVYIEVDEGHPDWVSVLRFEEGETDVDGQPLSVVTTSFPVKGLIDNDPTFVDYTPLGDDNGDDSFTVTVTDGVNNVTFNVFVTINPINDAPVANPDDYTATSMYDDYYDSFYSSYGNVFVLEDQTTELDLLDNDVDIDGDEVSVVMDSISIDPAEGSVTETSNGVLFTPAPDFYGFVSFTYVITDGELESEPADVEIYVIPTSDAPVAIDDEASVDEDDVVYVHVLDNDFDVDFGDPFDDFGDIVGPRFLSLSSDLELIEVSQPDGGYAAIAGDRLRVEPDPDFVGTLVIEYRIRSEYEPAWDPYYGTTIGDCSSPFHPFDGPYLPFPVGLALASDGLDEFDDSTWCPTAIGTLIVEVGAVNDAPVAENDTAETDEDESIVIDVLDNDADIDSDELSIWRAESADTGTTEIVDGGILYTPNDDEFGEDAFVYYVTDGEKIDLATVEVTINSINDDPTIADVTMTIDEDDEASFDVVLDDVEDPVEDLAFGVAEGPTVGDVDIDGSTVTYIPPQDFYGEVTFSLWVEDSDEGYAENDVTITVTSVNDLPTVTDVTDVIDEDTESTFALELDDVEDGTALTVTLGEGPANGDVAIDGSDITFTPTPNWNGEVGFTLVVTDSDGGEATASVTITVDPVNDKPTASDMFIEVDEDETIVFDFDTSEPDGDPLTLSLVDPPALLGDVTFDGTEITWTPSTNFAGPIVFEVRVDDGTGLSAIAEIFATVNGVNDIPVISPASAEVDEDGSVDIEIDAYDIDGFPVSIAVVDGPTNGSTSVDGLTVTYVPDADTNGDDSFVVEVTDSDDTTAQATVSVTVAPVQDAPVAVDCGPFTVEVDMSIDLAAADCGVDIDGDTLTVVADSATTTDGTVTTPNSDTVTFAAPAEAGEATVTFTLTDGNGGTAEASAIVTITASPNPFIGASGLQGEVVRIYTAMLGRQPDMTGFEWWVDQRAGGMTFEQMVDRFADSPEFKSIYGDMIRNATDEEWVEFVYTELMDRSSDLTGRAFWLGALESGRFSRSAMVIFFAQSPEYRQLTQTN